MFPENLKRCREAAGFTQASFAEKIGVPLRTVQNWEQGHREPGLAVLATLAKALSVSVDVLVAGGEKPNPKKPRGGPRKEK
jgi:transcriptional regulator with XRE-family HTH domain